MRVLCTCVPGYGHFHPMVPLAKALQAAGHEVAFATADRFCPRVIAAGFEAFPAGLNPGQMVERALQSFAAGQDAWRFGAHMFAGVAAPAKLPELLQVVDRWWPDLLVHDVTDFAGPPAATHAGVPGVAHTLGPMFPVEFHELAAELLPHERSALALDICPPSLQTSDVAGIAAVTHPLRPVPFDAVAGETLPEWVHQLPPRPTVYVTLGTLDNDAPGVIEAAVEGLRDEPLNVVVTVGPNRDPGELGAQPANVHVERYVPQSLLLPRCHAVVAHGGSGTTLAALAHGLPMLVLPQGANQFWNAQRCADLGVAIRLLAADVNAGAVREAVRSLLTAPTFRRRAGELAGEIAGMPAPEAVVALLESRSEIG